jgi:hypothetical protein
MPGAEWHPVRNYTNDGQDEVRGVVVHIMAGTLDGSQGWFNNPTAQASSHFGTGKAGALRQWVDTADRAWAQSAGNRAWLSVENEGKGGDALTDAQLDRNAQVLAWAHKVYDVPLRLATGPNDHGLAFHAMGGEAWGGHSSCPGPRIVAQLPEIVARAKKLAAAPTKENDDMDPIDVWAYRNKNAKGPIPDAYGYLTQTAGKVDALTKQVTALTKAVADLTALVKKG